MKSLSSKENDVCDNRFYKMSKFLFEGDCAKLSNDARIIYALLRDRYEFSLLNNWRNEKGEVILIYTRKNLERILGLTDKTVKKAIDQLKQLDLISEQRTGLNKPNYIVLNTERFEHTGRGKIPTPEPEILRFKNRRISVLMILILIKII